MNQSLCGYEEYYMCICVYVYMCICICVYVYMCIIWVYEFSLIWKE